MGSTYHTSERPVSRAGTVRWRRAHRETARRCGFMPKLKGAQQSATRNLGGGAGSTMRAFMVNPACLGRT